MKRKLLAVMLVAAMTASLAGCGNQGAGNPSSTPDSAVNGGRKAKEPREQRERAAGTDRSLFGLPAGRWERRRRTTSNVR